MCNIHYAQPSCVIQKVWKYETCLRKALNLDRPTKIQSLHLENPRISYKSGVVHLGVPFLWHTR